MSRTCKDVVEYFQARSGKLTVVVAPAEVPTVVRIEAPRHGSVVPVGETVTVSGTLAYVLGDGREYGLEGVEVEVYVNGVQVARARTGAGGRFSVGVSLARPGDYVILVRFPGIQL